MYDITLIKSRINCLDYASRIGLPVHRDGDRCKSPLRASSDNSTAFSVHTDYWHDFVSGDSGDVIDLCAATSHNGDRGLAIIELARITGVTNNRSPTDTVDWQQATQRRCSDVATWHDNLRLQDREYLYSRRITDETINRLRIGYTAQGIEVVIKGEKKYQFASNRIAIPTYKNGYVVSWVARALTPTQQPKYMKPPVDELSEHEPWGLHTLDRKAEYLYIAEGTFDALSLDQSGCCVLATMGGYFGKETLRHVISICKDFKCVILTFDNDAAGRKFTLDFGNILFSHRIPFKVAVIPPQYKDISEYYTAGKEIVDITLIEGITHIATSITDKEQFKAFAYKAARILDKSDLAEMLSVVDKTEKYNKAWLREVQQSCYHAPPEQVIVDDVLSKHRLLFFEEVGFYEYVSAGYWKRLSERVIEGYISESLGMFKSGNKFEPIKKLMKPYILINTPFDRNPVVNFINGTLELETGNFREHSEDDYCSIQLPYAYDPDARCPLWNKFLEQVTANDAKRIENLQFIAGYALFSDCRHEKVFVLTGEGGNGKTVFTKVITRLFGDTHITHITPRGLTEAFERIHLRDSMLNIAGEIKSDISGAEEVLKQIASGEPVQACYKGKDHITFTSRSKLIFCCNGQLKSSDTSEGLSRRLIIIDFPCRFLENPDPADPMQFQRDIGLLDRLYEEVSGIFNWAFQGYQDIHRYGEFTETDEHQQLMDNFKRSSNPVISFLEDLLDNPPDSITKSVLYSRYQSWCIETGHSHPMADGRFHQEFQRVSRKHYKTYEKTIRNGATVRKERGYEMMKITAQNEP